MKQALFIGAYDISDLLQYVSKIITLSGKKVLLVDATDEGYLRYGTDLPTPKLEVAEFEGFDVMPNCESYANLQLFLSNNHSYDHVIVYCTKTSFLKVEELKNFECKYVASTAERICLVKTRTLIQEVNFPSQNDTNDVHTHFKQIHVNNVAHNLSDDYLKVLFKYITWSEESHELLHDDIDYAMKINNQHNGQIRMQRLSKNFKRVICKISEEISGLEQNEIKNAMKQSVRRSFLWAK